jgi:hypothetical protein
LWNQQKTHDRTQSPEGNLERPQPDGRARGVQQSYTMKSSCYTRWALSPMTQVASIAAASVALLAARNYWK